MSTLLDEPEIDEEATAATAAAEENAAAALLGLSEVRAHLFPISVEAYYPLTEGRRTELLRGLIIEKVSKTPRHSYLGDEMREILSRQVSPGFVVFHEWPLRLSDSVPEPDVLVVRGTRKDFKHRHPESAELVVEVAVSSLALDRAKALIYAEAAVVEYWIVRPAKKQVEVYRCPSPAGYAEMLTLSVPHVLHSSALPGVSVDLAELFA
ncbi:MAG TPA: Uma2 family endonuclease [Chthoniobacteraceae bacterium]|jgi:Uma2 family endonuclease|nr:Uma2 family endonuclease [Chthoniobacteraceae bacterium]